MDEKAQEPTDDDTHGSPVEPGAGAAEESGKFKGRVVAAFESRRHAEMVRLIEKQGGQARVSPSMRELPQSDNDHAIDFAHRLLTGEITTVIFLTGVGFRYLLEAIETRVDRQRFLDCLSDITTIVRGPKPAAALKEVGIQPTLRVAEPNTWREILVLIDETPHFTLGNLILV
jgi:uroporphyrinogen decarboxylase